jgi:ABC-2 type transport system ATP-binding protein
MINTGEKLTVEIFKIEDSILEGVRNLPNILSADYSGNLIVAKSSTGNNNIVALLDYLKSKNIAVGKVYSEPPTLNDVFLEITGKELRD